MRLSKLLKEACILIVFGALFLNGVGQPVAYAQTVSPPLAVHATPINAASDCSFAMLALRVSGAVLTALNVEPKAAVPIKTELLSLIQNHKAPQLYQPLSRVFAPAAQFTVNWVPIISTLPTLLQCL